MLSYTGLAWLGSAGLASARLYYTAPYRFSVSMFRAPVLFNTHSLGLGLARVGKIAWAWAWFGLRLYYAAPYRIFGIDVSRTCPHVHTLAWLRLGLSPSDRFDKLNLMMIGLGWIIYLQLLIIIFVVGSYGYKPAFPLPDSPKASGTRIASLLLLLSLFVWLLSCLSAFDSFGFEFRVFLLFTCVLGCVDST